MPGELTYLCPICGSPDTRRSYLKGPLDALIRMAGRWPYRCRGCSHRFIRKPLSELDEAGRAEVEKASHRPGDLA